MEKALQEYRMVRRGDRILIGISGGPDSLSLFHLLRERFQHQRDIYLLAAHIDLGFPQSGSPQSEILESHFRASGIDYRVIHTNISAKFLADDAKKNPCFICSLYRRRKIYELAHAESCNKIAYGHHKDDIVETLLINILFGRKIEAIRPVQEVFQGKMSIIRPLSYVEEELLKKYAVESGLPQLSRLCPYDGQTRRQKIKEMISDLQKSEAHANIRENIFKSLSHVSLDIGP